jgi:hypothetical protein
MHRLGFVHREHKDVIVGMIDVIIDMINDYLHRPALCSALFVPVALCGAHGAYLGP